MAVEETTPHGLKKYTAGTDPIPGRTGHNQMIDRLNQIPGLGIGPLSARPIPSSGLRFWVEESTNRLSVNIGSSWVGIADVGGVTPGSIVVGGEAPEGSSSRSARADHSHSIRLATTLAHGAMSKEDKSKIDEVYSSNLPNTIPYRNSFGHTSFSQVLLESTVPTNPSHATRKDYVDNQIQGKMDRINVRAIGAGSGAFPALDATSGQGPYTHRSSAAITFPEGLFAATPAVTAQLITTNPGLFSSIGISSISSKGATLWVSGVGASPVNFHWQAVLQA